MPWAAAAGAVASAGIGAYGSSSAANTEAGAAKSATNLQRDMFTQTQGNLQPYMSAGNSSLRQLMIAMGMQPPALSNLEQYNSLTEDQKNQVWQDSLKQAGGNLELADQIFTARATPSGSGYAGMFPGIDKTSAAPGITPGMLTKPFTAADFQSSPGYDFQLKQGVNAIDNSSAAKGFTGNTLKDLMTYGQGIANQDWWNAYNAYTQRQQQTYNMLSGLSGSGQNAAVNLGGMGVKVGGQIGDNITGAGTAGAAGTIGATNAFGGAASNIGQNYMLYQLMQQNQGGGYNFSPDLVAASSAPSALSGGVGYGMSPY